MVTFLRLNIGLFLKEIEFHKKCKGVGGGWVGESNRRNFCQSVNTRTKAFDQPTKKTQENN